MPLVSSDIEAPIGTAPISLVHPRDMRSEQVIFSFKEYVELIPIGEHQLIAGNDPAVWLGNGLSSGLENAGYKVVRIGKIGDSKTRYTVSSELTQLAIHIDRGFFSSDCVSDVGATVQIFDASSKVFDKPYDGQYKGSCAISPADILERALDNLLNQAVPEMAGAIAHSAKPSVLSATP